MECNGSTETTDTSANDDYLEWHFLLLMTVELPLVALR